VIVWGGGEMIDRDGIRFQVPLNTGARYNPVTDTWLETTTVGAPTPRTGARAVWTGSEMIVWGGDDLFISPKSGGRYRP
jgi:hypothetical protein